MPGQHLAGGETPTWRGYKNRLHHAMRVGDELWAAVWHAGFRVLDVTDITQPRCVASHDYHPPFPEPTHTVMPLPGLEHFYLPSKARLLAAARELAALS